VKGLLPAFVAFVLPVLPAMADSREAAFRAQRWLGAGVPARVIRLTNDPAVNGRPAEFHGLVVAFADILWLYTEFDGTQNLSLRRGQVAADEANLLALLQQSVPGVTGWTDDLDPPPALADPVAPLPNGCFIACVARWEKLRRDRDPPVRVRLLACYPPDRRAGHMLLEFERGRARYVFDPAAPAELHRWPARLADDPLAIATATLEPRWRVKPVKVTAVEVPAPPAGPAGPRVAGEPPRPPSRG
jgi:hypothetical protein